MKFNHLTWIKSNRSYFFCAIKTSTQKESDGQYVNINVDNNEHLRQIKKELSRLPQVNNVSFRNSLPLEGDPFVELRFEINLDLDVDLEQKQEIEMEDQTEDISAERKHRYVSDLQTSIDRIKKHAGDVEGFEFDPERLESLVTALEDRLAEGNIIVSRMEFLTACRELDFTADHIEREAKADKKDSNAPKELKALLATAVVHLEKGIEAIDMSDLNDRARSRKALAQQMRTEPLPEGIELD